MRTKKEFRAGANDEGRRLDRVLRILLSGLSLPEIYGALRKKAILVNGRKALPSLRLVGGDRIQIDEGLCPGLVPEAFLVPEASPCPTAPGASDLGIPSLLRTPDILILNKPRGLATHGLGSLETQVREAEAATRLGSLAFTPGPLHRLDRNTSGAIAFSLSIDGAREFTRALREGLVSKTYLALVQGELAASELWEDELVRDGDTRTSHAGKGGALARSRARPLIVAKGLSLLEVDIDTGRTHQIRVQAALHGHPLMGDVKYGGRPAEFYVLHARRLSFKEAFLPGLPGSVYAPLPAASTAILLSSLGLPSLDFDAQA